MCDSFCQFESSPLMTIHLILSPRPSVRPSIQLDQRDQMLVSRPSGEKKQSVSNSPRVSRSVGMPFSQPVSSSVSQSVSQLESHLVKPVRPVSHTFFQWYSRVWCQIRGEARIFKGGVTEATHQITIRGSPTIYGLYRCSPSCISGLSRIIAA